MPPAPRILVVEDEFLIALEMVEALRAAGYQVLGPAPSVDAALELLKAERGAPPDLRKCPPPHQPAGGWAATVG